ncbi:uncharacterized protein LOC133511237 [Syngnathoides biaculeatus]|uniref:uncharacterized protein LOC133511237 n=1 Tax=Syngnathoides biaculeatus TaxID=300417 RepID=UPI002ADE1D7A|nr:uncharacterized protein LOC133511237 [Syngnathoides biaculeatus]
MSVSATARVFSDRVKHLEGDDKRRYVEKLETLGIEDPFLMPTSMFSPIRDLTVNSRPSLGQLDILMFLLNKSSIFTQKSLKAYKTLDAYKYFDAGLVRDVVSCRTERNKSHLVMAKVLHSQEQSEPPLHPWMAIDEDGSILFAHCTCMAGLDEVCSHVAATCFAVEAEIRIANSTSCASVAPSWLEPSVSMPFEYAETIKINFTSSQCRQSKGVDYMEVPQSVVYRELGPLTADDTTSFYQRLNGTGAKLPVLSVLPEFSKNYIPEVVSVPLSRPLTDLFDESWLHASFEDLSVHCMDVYNSISMSQDEINGVEFHTRRQSQSDAWFSFSAGRITASVLRAVTRTRPDKPSVSLIAKICYPKSHSFSTKATRWGCKHEETARTEYENLMESKHTGFTIRECGLFIDATFPFIGASPYALVTCDCCESWILEIKCPYCHIDPTIETATENSDFYIRNESGKLTLKQDHAYYFQIQCQLHATQKQYCDFVVCTNSTIFIERIEPDTNLFSEIVKSAETFFKSCILPELVAKYFTQERALPSITDDVCYCKEADEKKTLIICSSDTCTVKYFHQECLGLTSGSKNWKCSGCKKLERFQKDQLSKYDD